jgi:hypothetical protein
MAAYAFFVIGNTYKRIPEENAKFDRTGAFRKVHEWSVYLDVVEGFSSVIARIDVDLGMGFIPRELVSNWSKKIEQPYSIPSSRWRCFTTQQQTYARLPWNLKFTLTGVGGTPLQLEYAVRFYDYEEPRQHFFEPNIDHIPNWGPLPLPTQVGFRLELLEIPTTPPEETLNQMETDLCAIHKQNDQTKLIQEDKYESNLLFYQSPILYGDEGIKECTKIIRQHSASSFLPRIFLDVQGKQPKDILKICQNFVKYEDSIDSILQNIDGVVRQRELYRYKSNKQAVQGGSNKSRHTKLASCTTIQELCDCMNPEPSAIYKFNLGFFESKSPTVEFCFDTCESSIIESLIRFSVLFVHNSIRFKPPLSLKKNRTLEEQLDYLFGLIKDKHIENSLRRKVYQNDDLATISMQDLTSSDGRELDSFFDNLDLDDSFAEHPTLIDVYQNGHSDQTPPNRKRPRHGDSQKPGQSSSPSPVQSNLPLTTPYIFNNGPSVETPLLPLKKIFRSSIDKLKHRELGPILPRFNISKYGKTEKRKDALFLYFDTRSKEISEYFETQGNYSMEKGSKVGIELVRESEKGSVNITIYIRGGRKLTRQRKYDYDANCNQETMSKQPLSESRLSLEELADVLKFFQRPIAQDLDRRIAELDQFIEELVAEKARCVEEKRLPKEKAAQEARIAEEKGPPEETRMKAEYEEGKNYNFVVVHDVPPDPSK